MKKSILFAAFLAMNVAASSAQNLAIRTTFEQPIANGTSFKWKNTSHDFGKIPQGQPVTVAFQFTNNGNEPLLLTEVKGSCGCTVVDYPRAAIAPGKTSLIKATYNAANVGAFNKTVTVTANTEGTTQLTLKGEVLAPTK